MSFSRALNRIKAQVIFYPTLGWNILLGRVLRVRNWWDSVDPFVIVGAMPFASDIEKLASKESVGAVVNTCEEYEGPVKEYQKFGIDQFRMPTIDFTHPSFEDVCRAVEFVQQNVANEKTVYIHCKAGRARSATVAICWLMKYRGMSGQEAQQWLLQNRPHVNPRLTSRPVVQQFERELSGGRDN
ncbi:MAG: phosphatidylglycerophosphatase and protein-tyrosine phosphatase 1 family protein [Planctomycetota bacterium]